MQLADAQRQVATALYENDRLQGKVPRAVPEPRTDMSTADAVCCEGFLIRFSTQTACLYISDACRLCSLRNRPSLGALVRD
jgi:hypothetical protein